MNTEIELSPKQLEALTVILGKKNGTSHTGLKRELQCEMSLASNLIRQLLDLEYLTEFSNGLFGVSREGRDYLIKMKVPSAERKPTGAAAHANDYVDPYDMPPKKEPSKVIVVPSFLESDKFKETFLTGGLEDPKIHPELTAPEWPEQQTPMSKEDEWQELILKGLARLNEQLGYESVKIDNLEQKTFVLLRLAGSLTSVSPELGMLLTEISKDLRKAGGVK